MSVKRYRPTKELTIQPQGTNRPIKGKWVQINEQSVFRVIFVDPKGEVKKVEANSMFSHDIDRAMLAAA